MPTALGVRSRAGVVRQRRPAPTRVAPPPAAARPRTDGAVHPLLRVQATAGNRAATMLAAQRQDPPTATLEPRDLAEIRRDLERTAAVEARLRRRCDDADELAFDLFHLNASIAAAADDRRALDRTAAAAHDGYQQLTSATGRLRDEITARMDAARAGLDATPAQRPTALRRVHETAQALSQLDAEVVKAVKAIGDQAFAAAAKAEAQGDIRTARNAFAVADKAEAHAPRARVDVLTGKAPVDKVGIGYGYVVDTGANTTGGGVGGGTYSMAVMIAEKSATASTVGTSVVGGIAGAAGVIFGAIDLALAIRGGISSARREAQLKELKTTLANPELREVADYAAEQKRKKKYGRAVSGVLAGAAIAAGIVGLVALGVATLGVGAVVFGIGAAALGLSVLAYRAFHKKRKRRHELAHMADELIDAATGRGAAAEAARARIDRYGLAPPDGSYAGVDRSALAAKLKEDGQSRRGITATTLLDLLVNGKRSERHDTARVLETLGLDPAKLQSLVEAGKGRKARDQVKGKLGTW